MPGTTDHAAPHFARIDLEGYKPATLADQPAPSLTWARIDQLVIDRAYQRDITAAGRRAVQRIADNFDWTKFGAVQLAPLEGGRLAIVDGQHRAHAAALVGLETIPALITPMSARQQASGFAAMNRDRIRVDALQIYRAELAAGTGWAVACRDAVEAAGCTLMTAKWSHERKRPRQVFAIGLVRRMIADGEAAAVTAGLDAIRRSTHGAAAQAYLGTTLTLWLPALARNQQFLRLDLPAVFDGIDFDHVMDDARIRAKHTGQAARPMALEAVTEILRDHLRRAT